MLKRIGLSIALLAVGYHCWAREEVTRNGVPESVPVQSQIPGANGGDDGRVPVKGPVDDSLTPTDRSAPAPFDESALVNSVPAQSEELKVVTYRLDVKIPDNLLILLGPLLGPDGQYEYEDEIGLLVLRGNEKGLRDATEFIEALTNTFKSVYEEEMKKVEPRPVQIEAVLLLGRKARDFVLTATETTLPYPIPAEVGYLGLDEEDLLPFAFERLEVVGRAVLHTDIPPSHLRPSPVMTDLAGHRLEFYIAHRAEPSDYPYLSVTASYTPGMDSSEMHPVQGVPQHWAPGLGGGTPGQTGGFGYGGMGYGVATYGRQDRNPESGEEFDPNSSSMGMTPGQFGRGRASQGVVGFPPRGVAVGMTSEPKAVFDRPILVGSYKPTPEDTAILAIRLSLLEE